MTIKGMRQTLAKYLINGGLGQIEAHDAAQNPAESVLQFLGSPGLDFAYLQSAPLPLGLRRVILGGFVVVGPSRVGLIEPGGGRDRGYHAQNLGLLLAVAGIDGTGGRGRGWTGLDQTTATASTSAAAHVGHGFPAPLVGRRRFFALLDPGGTQTAAIGAVTAELAATAGGRGRR